MTRGVTTLTYRASVPGAASPSDVTVPRQVAAAVSRFRDPGLALTLLVLGEYELWSGLTYEGAPVWPGPDLVSAVAVVLLTLPLAWRRRHPDLVCGTVLTGLLVLSAAVGAGEATTAFLLFIVASYTAAAYARRPVPLLVLAIAAGAVHQARNPHVHGLGDVVWAAGMLAIAWLIGYAVRRRQLQIGSLEYAAEEADRTHRERVEAATRAERAAIARELHDVIAHSVAVIVIQAQAGARALPGEVERARQVLDTIEDNARAAMVELRQLLTLLSDGEVDAGVQPLASVRRVDDLVSTFRGVGLRVRCQVDGALPGLDPTADLAAYRVVQEALTNALRHAPGTTVEVRLRQERGRLRITVCDSGPGPAREAPAPVSVDGSGRGLIGMRERLTLAGGELLHAGPDGPGFLVEAVLPCHEQEQPHAAQVELA
jgi:signal transduction histidine kinase